MITVRANTNADEHDRLPEKELIGQISYVLPLLMNTLTMLRSGTDVPNRTFVFAAMDTTSNALAMTLSLLAEHPEVQQKLSEEILEASKSQDLDYDALVSLPYLDAVCRETLRLYVLFAISRSEVWYADSTLRLRMQSSAHCTDIPRVSSAGYHSPIQNVRILKRTDYDTGPGRTQSFPCPHL